MTHSHHDGSDEPPPDAVGVPSNRRPYVVLVVDDDSRMRDLLRTQLESDRYVVFEATNGVDALTRIAHLLPDLVLLDQMMPVMDGITTCSLLRQQPAGDAIPIVMLTALDDAEVVDAAFAAGATDYIQKPFSWPILRQRIRALLAGERTVAELRLQQRAMNATPHGIMITNAGDDHRILHVNPALLELFDVPESRFSGQPLDGLVRAYVPDSASAGAVMALATHGQSHAVVSCISATGQPFWADVTVAPLQDAHGLASHVVWTIQEVTERVMEDQARQQALQHEKALASMVATLNRPLSIETLLAEVLNQAQRQLHAEVSSIYLYEPATDLLHLAYIIGEKDPIRMPRIHSLGSGITGSVAATRRIRMVTDIPTQEPSLAAEVRQSGILSQVSFPLMVSDTLVGVASFCRRMAGEFDEPMVGVVATIMQQLAIAIDRTRLYERLIEQAVRDPLTGLYNRRYLEASLHEAFELARAERHPIAILMLDLDTFKLINDTHGHAAGDAILKEIARRFQEMVTPRDLIYRYGGEELMIVLPGRTMRDAVGFVNALRERLQREGLLWDQSTMLTMPTFSVGIATFPQHGQRWESVLKAADSAMYLAKAAGRNRIYIADSVVGPLTASS